MSIFSKLFGKGKKDATYDVVTSEASSLKGGGFSMPIREVFNMEGRGMIATGRVEAGVIAVGDKVTITGGKEPITAKVAFIESYSKPLTEAHISQDIGILFEALTAPLTPGMVVVSI